MAPVTTILILLLTATVSVIAFRRHDWLERLMFKPTEILRYKQFERMLTATLMFPEKIFAAPWMFAGVLALSMTILIVLIRDPGQLLEFRFSYGAQPKGHQRYHRYDEARERREKMEAIDQLLDKVAAQGIHSLTRGERKKLDQLSKEVGERR